ncbi:chaperone [Lithospermum erythrorhizon]|uniref:protein disulfide-isomerase n=1 Tax=Lithospermum erythrorhizon TaxID=34254 RepID=A0AAV3P3X0_LITER
MAKLKPISRLIFSTLIVLIFAAFLVSTAFSSDHLDLDEDMNEVDDIEELIALDEAEEQNPESNNEESKERLSEAQVLSKAQRIVIEFNNDNIKKGIEGNEYVLVLGYAPWCMRSAELMPRFAESATVLKGLNSQIKMAKIDGDRYPQAAGSIGIKGFPTLILFINGTSQPYTGGFSTEEIVIWVRKKTGVPVIRIGSVDEANEFLTKHSTFVIGMFKKFEGSDYEEFMKAAKSDNEMQFVATNIKEVAELMFPNLKPSSLFLGLVKSEPEKYTTYEGEFYEDRILQFLDDNKFPLVSVLTELNSAKVYGSLNKIQLYVFAEADDLTKLLQPLQDIARKVKSKIMIVFVNIKEENLAKPFLTLYGLEESEDTVVAAYNYSSSSKFLLEMDPTPKNIEEFCSSLVDGTISPFYRSQPIPDNKNASINIVVGKTFDDLVLSSPKNILLEVHTPWCIACETTSKQVEKLAKHFKGLDNLTFARIDASSNEHPLLQVDDYPALLFYPAGDKSNPIKFATTSSSKELAVRINDILKSQESVGKDEL